MGWRKRLQAKPPEREPALIYVATVGLLMAVASYAIPNERLAEMLFSSGLITAGFCVVYWLANPTYSDD